MRTIKRKALPLNKSKLIDIQLLCKAYAAEKNHWLDVLRGWKYQSLLGTPRKIRDEFIHHKYQSNYGLQARHWKLALQDAVETWDKNWKAHFVSIRPKIVSHFKKEAERHYAYWLLKGYSQFSEMMQGKVPKASFEIDEKSCKRIATYIQRQVKKGRPKQAVVKKARSIKFDESCYSVFEERGTQYIKIMSLEKGKRIVIPLKGKGPIEGNITLVIDDEDLFIHVTKEILPFEAFDEDIEAVDFGYSEVMTDTEGKRYGTQFGKILNKISDHRHKKMQKRHKLHAYEKKQFKKYLRKTNIKKYNLGNKKLNQVNKKGRISLEKEINTGINELLRNKKPCILITEDLSHSFSYDQVKSVNRRLSSWLRGKLQERVAFKALAEGFRHEQVNPAYGSQTCTCCDFVDSKNRNKDKFKCLHCGHEDLSDRVAAMNYARRFGDQKIGLHMPPSQVKTILLDRFHRRLETRKLVTVPDWTLETVEDICPQMSFEIAKLSQPGEMISQTGRSIRERNKINTF
jgi:putative transposase